MKEKIAIIGVTAFSLLMAGLIGVGVASVGHASMAQTFNNLHDIEYLDKVNFVTAKTEANAQNNTASWLGDNFWAGGNINIQNAHAGAVIDTWPRDTILDNGYQYHAGKPLCISVYNNTDKEKQYEIGFDNGVQGLPENYKDWVTLADWNPTIPARTVADIPLSIKFPEKLGNDIPHSWEFRLYVVSNKGSGYQVAGNIRIFVTMR